MRDDVEGLECLERYPVGTATVLRRITSGRVQRRRLAELGFVPGSRVEVVGRGGVRGLVLAVHADTRVAMDAATARGLWVEPPARAAGEPARG